MQRIAFAARIKEGKKDAFRRTLGTAGEDIRQLLIKYEITNSSLWAAGDMVFAYGEAPDEYEMSEDSIADAKEVFKTFGEELDWISGPGKRMRLMYQNFGLIRTNKTFIRHRVFMTILKPGCSEEYRRRHKGLEDARGNAPDPGPDSNFSIWSDGNYIFGYDEIDTTMETEETKEAHEATVLWETNQLAIMDWITDDVDWLTGEKHDRVLQLAEWR